jgi:hypothetical protein
MEEFELWGQLAPAFQDLSSLWTSSGSTSTCLEEGDWTLHQRPNRPATNRMIVAQIQRYQIFRVSRLPTARTPPWARPRHRIGTRPLAQTLHRTPAGPTTKHFGQMGRSQRPQVTRVGSLRCR